MSAGRSGQLKELVGKVRNIIFKKLSDQICVCAESKCQMLQTLLPSQFISFFNLAALLFACSLTHCGRVTQICVFNTVKLGTSASSA